MVFPILPDQLRIPLEAPYQGITAVVRPVDAEQKARWFDAFPNEKTRMEAAGALVRQQLDALEGVQMQGGDGALVPFDPKNPVHLRWLPLGLIGVIYATLSERANVPEALEKNSDSPSVLDGTSSGPATGVETVANEPGIV